MAFTNIYEEVAGTAELKVTKEVDWSESVLPFEGEDELTFKLAKYNEGGEETTDVLPINTTVTVKGDGKGGFSTATFGSIAYTKGGEYYYTITEVEPEKKTEGMTYNTEPVYARVDIDPKFEADPKIYYGASVAEVDTLADAGNAVTDDEPATITNTYKARTVSATVKKVWDDLENKFKDRPKELKVTLGYEEGDTIIPVKDVTLNDDNKWTATIENLQYYDEDGNPRKYSWSEDKLPEGYVLKSNNPETAADGSITATLTNHRLRGRLHVTKTVNTPKMELTEAQRKLISFEIKGAHINETLTLADFNKVESKQKTVDDSIEYQSDGAALGAQAEGDSTDGAGSGSDAGDQANGSDAAGSDANAGEGKGSYLATSYDWYSDWLPLTGDEEKDSYTVKETNSMYEWIDTRTYKVNDGDEVTSEEGVAAPLYDEKTTDVWISDTLVPPALVISKELVSSNASTDADAADKNADEADASDDTSADVDEADASDDTSADVDEADASDDTSDDAADANFTFAIKLDVDENANVAAAKNRAWKDAKYPATLKGTSGETESSVQFKDGAATVTLKAGQSLAIDYLPIGATYVVTEVPTDGYTLAKIEGNGTVDMATASITGTISTDEIDDLQAKFTNAREEEPVDGTLTVKKVVSSTRSDDKKRDFGFKVTLSDTTINGTYGEMEFKDGVATFTLKDGETKTASGLPLDEKGELGYTVDETDSGGLKYSFSEVKSKNGAGATVTCTNTYTPPTEDNKKSSSTGGTVSGSTGSTASRAATAKTGDETNYVAVAAVAVAGVVAIGFGRRRRRRD